MIGLVLRSFGQYWVLIVGALMIGGLSWQNNLIVEQRQQILALQMAARALNQQVIEHQVKAQIIDRLRRQMHNETITLRDELAERRKHTAQTSEAIMLQPVSREEYQSIQWLHESIKDLNFGPVYK